jgi:hypothetical protein
MVCTPRGCGCEWQFREDLLQGLGTRVYPTGVRYTGTFSAGFPDRRGIFFYPEGNATYNGKVRARTHQLTGGGGGGGKGLFRGCAPPGEFPHAPALTPPPPNGCRLTWVCVVVVGK